MEEWSEDLRMSIIQMQTMLMRHNSSEDDVYLMLAGKFNIPYQTIKYKLGNLKKVYQRYVKEERVLTPWMKIFFLNDKSSKLVLPMKDEAVVMEIEASNISMSNMSDVEMAQDFDKENKEEVKVSADIQEILFEAYVESVKKQILARSNEIRNLYRKVMDDFLFNNPN